MDRGSIKYIVILCTTGSKLDDLLININSLENQEVDIDLIVVTQGNHDAVERMLQNCKIHYKHIYDNGTGLSRARNIALKNIGSEHKDRLLIFSDDDNWYPAGSLKEAGSVLRKNNSPICIFQYFDEKRGQYPKQYSQKPHFISYLDILHISSIEIVIDLNKVDKELIQFNEELGVGTKIPSGEENELIIRLKKQGFKIYYYPFIISYHTYKTKNTKFNEAYFIEKKQLCVKGKVVDFAKCKKDRRKSGKI